MLDSQIHEYLEYKDGGVFWKKSKGSRGVVGDRVGSPDGKGYRHTYFNGKKYREHQLVWILCNNEEPSTLDHINGNRSDNRIENLRLVSNSENLFNSPLRKDNKTGCKNVMWKEDKKRFVVEIKAHKNRFRLGSFKDLELADLVAQEGRDLFHGKFARNF